MVRRGSSWFVRRGHRPRRRKFKHGFTHKAKASRGPRWRKVKASRGGRWPRSAVVAPAGRRGSNRPSWFVVVRRGSSAVAVVDALRAVYHTAQHLEDDVLWDRERGAAQSRLEALDGFSWRSNLLRHAALDLVPQSVIASIEIWGIRRELDRGDVQIFLGLLRVVGFVARRIVVLDDGVAPLPPMRPHQCRADDFLVHFRGLGAGPLAIQVMPDPDLALDDAGNKADPSKVGAVLAFVWFGVSLFQTSAALPEDEAHLRLLQVLLAPHGLRERPPLVVHGEMHTGCPILPREFAQRVADPLPLGLVDVVPSELRSRPPCLNTESLLHVLRSRGAVDGGDARLVNDLVPSDLPLAVGLRDKLVPDAVHRVEVCGAQSLLPASRLRSRSLESLAPDEPTDCRQVRTGLPSAPPVLH